MKYRPELDGIRGLAILAVLASHGGLMTHAGTVGVTLFFVLSGFLITSLLMVERQSTGRVSLRAFYERRARRLLPALVAVIGFTGLVSLWMGRGSDYPAQAFLALFYAGNLALSAGFDMGYLSQTWSLALEEQFYLVFPVLFLWVRDRRLVLLLGVAVAVSICLRFVVGAETSTTYARPDLRVDAILVGCLMALRPWEASRRWGIAGLVLACLAPFAPTTALILTFATIASVPIVAAASRLPFLAHPILVRVGQISYGLYLWHYAIGRTVDNLVVVLVASFALALFSERYIERPLRRRREPDLHGPVRVIEPLVQHA